MRKILIVIATLAAISSAKLNEQQKENFFDFVHAFPEGRNFLSQVTNHIIEQTEPYMKFIYGTREVGSSYGDWVACETCKATVYGIDETLRTKVATKALESFGILVCNQLEATNDTVCPGAVTEMGDIIVPVLTNFLLSSDYICSRILNYCEQEYKELNQTDYVSRILSDKPDFLKTNDYVNNLYKTIKGQQNRKTFKAVHYSDVHVDLNYIPGTNANCNMPLCCRAENGIPENPVDAAGYWGDYRCDTTHPVVTKMFEFIRDEIKPDVLFWTGDMSPHSVWENSNQEVADVNTIIAKEMFDTFGDSFMVYPLQGNHDVWPVNVQSFNEPSYLVQNLSTVWNYWLDGNAISTFKKAGYYYQYFELKGQNKLFNKTRVLGVTTQTCNEQNWYLWEVLSDPGDELAWLEGVLKDMDSKNESAILLGHIPTHGCLRAWGSRFQALMDRYQHIIRFGLFGHSHDETFFLTRSVNINGNFSETKPLAFNSILAPTTTYTGKNPSFAVYEIDEETMLLVNITTYVFNITKANLGNPEWELFHNILEDYGMEDASPDSFHKFAESVLNDENVAKKLNYWNAKGGPDGEMESCDSNCRRGNYCNIATSYTDDEDLCNQGEYSAKKKKDPHSPKPFGFDKFQNLFMISEDQFYEIMSDPWLEKI